MEAPVEVMVVGYESSIEELNIMVNGCPNFAE